MKGISEHILNELKDKNIRLSHQRLIILEYLVNNKIQPTADQICMDLRKTAPTLSKTTIYNTLDLFMEAGIIKPLNIEDNGIRYDITTENHGHFKCESCGEVHDFIFDIDLYPVKDMSKYFVRQKEVYFKGLCPACLENANSLS